jgi:hypothetical protein
MKVIWIWLITLLFIVPAASAQVDTNKVAIKKTIVRICAPSRGTLLAPPLIVVFSHDKIIFKSATANAINKISPNAIQAVNVLKDSTSIAKYGALAKNGIVEIYINDKDYPEAYKAFKSDSTVNEKNKR